MRCGHSFFFRKPEIVQICIWCVLIFYLFFIYFYRLYIIEFLGSPRIAGVVALMIPWKRQSYTGKRHSLPFENNCKCQEIHVSSQGSLMSLRKLTLARACRNDNRLQTYIDLSQNLDFSVTQKIMLQPDALPAISKNGLSFTAFLSCGDMIVTSRICRFYGFGGTVQVIVEAINEASLVYVVVTMQSLYCVFVVSTLDESAIVNSEFVLTCANPQKTSQSTTEASLIYSANTVFRAGADTTNERVRKSIVQPAIVIEKQSTTPSSNSTQHHKKIPENYQ